MAVLPEIGVMKSKCTKIRIKFFIIKKGLAFQTATDFLNTSDATGYLLLPSFQ